MTLRVFIHLRSKRAEAPALLDSGATENFISQEYAKYLHLPIKKLLEAQKLFNMDRTPNRAGDLHHYVDLATRTGTRTTKLRYFLTNLGENHLILGYLWFAAAQPKIDWAKGWINYSQLPIILKANDADKACFQPQSTKQPWMHIRSTNENLLKVPEPYWGFKKVFSDQESKKLPPSCPWDHKIELKLGAPLTLIS